MNPQPFIHWAKGREVTFRTCNGEQHWLFRRDNVMVEFWPSTGKTVQDKQWDRSRRTQDAATLLRWLGNAFPEPEKEVIRPAFWARLEALDCVEALN
jgi:hypothetical protein